MEPPEKYTNFFYFGMLCIAIISLIGMISLFNFHDPIFSRGLLYLPVVFIILVFGYAVWIKSGVGQDRTSPISGDEENTRKRQFITHLNTTDAYDLCLRSIETFDLAELIESDPKKGTIRARVDLGFEISYRISWRSGGRSEILLEGSIIDDGNPPLHDDMSESMNQQVITVLDYLNRYLLTELSEKYGEFSLMFAGDVQGLPSRKKSVWLSAFLSLISPGMGQQYNGQFIRGITILILTVFGLIIFLIPGIIVWLFGIVDAARLAQKVNDGKYPYVSVHPIMLSAGIIATIPLLVFSLGAFILVAFGKTGVQMIGAFLGG